MDYEFFESLTVDQAQRFLNDFRESQEQTLEELRPFAADDGVKLDHALSSLPDALKWMVKRVRVHWIPVPDNEPSWIRQAHPEGLIEFDDDSKTMIFLAAYYLGECFAHLPGMRWATGNVEYMGKHMPVVGGFCLDDELPPLVVIRNMFARILGRGAPITGIDSTIKEWQLKLPAEPT